MLPIRAQAPPFTAESTLGTVHLEDYIGKRPIVLIFYPKDQTPICTRQLCAARDSQEQYAALSAAVFGVNPGTLAEHRRFAAKYGFDFPLISDADLAINRLYDVGKSLLLPGQRRVVYVIDRWGRIVLARRGNRSTAEIVSALQN